MKIKGKEGLICKVPEGERVGKLCRDGEVNCGETQTQASSEKGRVNAVPDRSSGVKKVVVQ